MPTISMFYGILVAIFFEDNDRHNLPHIHVRYSGHKAAVAIEDGSVLAGGLPFTKASVEYGTVVWPGNIDIAPETLYDRSLPV